MLLCLLTSALAAEPISLFSGEVRGGLAVDGSGVATPHNDTSTWYAGPDFVVYMPPDAVAEEVWLILVAKNGGFPTQPETRVMVNSVSLTLGELVDSDERVLVYRLPSADFGVVAGGEYPYEETGSAEEEARDGAGISGATLAVRYSEPDGRARRRVALLAGYASAVGDSFSARSFSNGSVPDGGEVVVSIGVAWECAEEQDGSATLSGVELSNEVGGRDDGGSSATACTGNWNSLWTQGSFGADEAGLLVGVDGDDPDAEPPEGVPSNSRLSDELWRVAYGGQSSPEVAYASDTSDSWMSVVALSLDLDSDGDGLLDEADGCTDLDGDGFGNADFNPDCTVDCDDGDTRVGAPKGYADRDGDGFGNRRDYVCVETDGFIDDDTDCDDTRADVNPDGEEVCDPDDVDEDCDGVSDNDDPDARGTTDWFVDADADGYGNPDELVAACDPEPGAWSADDSDCDDSRPDVHPAALEVCDDANADEDCDGLRDDDDPDTTAEFFWYRDADEDGYGDPLAVRTACDIDPGEVADRTDCDDADGAIYPGAPDAFFDGIDSDCNGDDAPAPADPKECGCNTGAPLAAAWLPALALVILRRRGTPGQGG
jgi:hypothetical protein